MTRMNSDNTKVPYAAAQAKFLYELSLSKLPAGVVHTAKRHILDTLGVAVRGQSHPNVKSMAESIAELDGSFGTRVVWGSSLKLSTAYAAMLNGVASHALDFDDTHTDAIHHGSASIVPVVLALGEELNSSGRSIIEAFVAGWEISARVGLAARGSFHRRGFHTTSVAGVFGAAAAASKLLGLDPSQTTNALGLAGSQASGINEYLSNGSSSKSFHTGWIAFAGILVAFMGKHGMTGPQTVFEGRDGLFKAFGEPDRANLNQLVNKLGEQWEVMRVSIKPYPCCHFAHAFIDCLGQAIDRLIPVREIKSITCVVPEIEVPLICEPSADKLNPGTPYAAKFSLPFLLGARAIDGKINHETFSIRSIRRPEVLEFAKKVNYRLAGPKELPFPETFPGMLEIQLTNGEVWKERLDVNSGHPSRPLSDLQIEDKFRENTRDIFGREHASRVVESIWSLEHQTTRSLAEKLSI